MEDFLKKGIAVWRKLESSSTGFSEWLTESEATVDQEFVGSTVEEAEVYFNVIVVSCVIVVRVIVVLVVMVESVIVVRVIVVLVMVVLVMVECVIVVRVIVVLVMMESVIVVRVIVDCDCGEGD